jgi:hypothetical protein
MCRLIAVVVLALALSGCSRETPPEPDTTPAPQPAPQSPPLQTEAPPVPFEDAGACPFEGCVYRDWIATDTVVVRAARDAASAAAFTVEKGESVTALTGVVVTVSPGIVEFRNPATLSTRQGELQMETGERLYVLTYQGEGFTKAWFRGRLYEDVDGGRFFEQRVVAPWKSVWWIQVRNSKGQTGWTNEPEKFGNKDLRA